MLPDWALPLASLPRAALIEYSESDKRIWGQGGILCTFRFSLYSECNCGLQLIIYMYIYIYSIYGIYKFLFSTFAFAHSILIINGSSHFCFCSINNSFVIGIKNNKHTNIFYGCNCCKTLWIALSKLNVSVCLCVC